VSPFAFAKPSFYPLNYGDEAICDLESPAVASHPLRRFPNADCPEASDQSGPTAKTGAFDLNQTCLFILVRPSSIRARAYQDCHCFGMFDGFGGR
jgi:hypothetical protein